MRFAWLRENSDWKEPAKPGFSDRLIYFAYNVIWWIPIVLGFTKVIDYRTAFITFFIITLIRALVNLYRINILAPEQAEVFPLRA